MNRLQTLILALGVAGVLYIVASAGGVISPELILVVGIMLLPVIVLAAIIGGIVYAIK